MAEWNWEHLAIEAGVSLISGAGGLLVGIWKWGRSSAKHEQKVKDDYDGKIATLRGEMKAAIDTADDRGTVLVGQFKESFEGIRRQIDQLKFDTERDFLRKDDFREFREEYREDIRDIKASIASIPR